MTMIRNTLLAAAASLIAVTGVVAPASAQRDPEYAAARANGSIGEQIDGYIGIVGAATPELQRLVNNINIRRKAVYAERAKETDSTLEQYAASAACQAIARTEQGEKYQAPDGTWKTRTAAPPERPAGCP